MLIYSSTVLPQVSKSDGFAHTYSIVARDMNTGEMAVGVQSHWFAVGTSVAWGKSGVGVVATQSFINPAYGPKGIEFMESGKDAAYVLRLLVEKDDGRDYRQVAMLDKDGNVSAYTGKSCIESAFHIVGENYSVQANMMLNDRVVPAMAEAFESNSHLPLAERVLKVMKAAQKEGGDIRGKQSAAIIVVSGSPAKYPWEDKIVDLRVDDHEEPLVELERLLKVHKAYEHMNRGDIAIEDNNMILAMEEYAAAEKMFPENLEMKYWKAIALANSGKVEEALPVFKSVFLSNDHWRELTMRLPQSGILTVSQSDYERIIHVASKRKGARK